jgi:hypothetical protein
MCVWREPGTLAAGCDVSVLLSPARFAVLDVIGLGSAALRAFSPSCLSLRVMPSIGVTRGDSRAVLL